LKKLNKIKLSLSRKNNDIKIFKDYIQYRLREKKRSKIKYILKAGIKIKLKKQKIKQRKLLRKKYKKQIKGRKKYIKNKYYKGKKLKQRKPL
jgi:hypothetical protein